MSWVDRVIGVIVVIQAIRGRARGALLQLGSLAGVVAGYIAGSIIALPLSSAITHARWRPLLALGIILAAAVLGSYLGLLIGVTIRHSLQFLKVGFIDSIGGVVLGVGESLLVCWLFAGLLSATSWGGLDRGIQQSQIIAVMDKVMPPLPTVVGKVQALFRYGDFPGVFTTTVDPTLRGSAPTARALRVVQHLTAPANVLEVVASGACATTHEGTAFFVGPHEAVTNAHVVAGSTTVSVGGARAQVALFDPKNDIAVLRVASLDEPSSSFLDTTPVAGSAGLVVGYPGAMSRTGSYAVLRGEITAQARDIYNTTTFRRVVLVVDANVSPGSSGSPVFVHNLVAGVIFAKSYGQQFTAYAVPADVVRRDVALAPAKGSVSTQNCLN